MPSIRYLLGYIPGDNRLYLGDKELNVVSFQLLLSVLEYQTAVMRRQVTRDTLYICKLVHAGTLTRQTKCCQQCRKNKELVWLIFWKSKASRNKLLPSAVIQSTGWVFRWK